MNSHPDRQLPAEITSDSAFVQGRVPLGQAAFTDEEELRSVWGQAWGASTDVGTLRRVLLRRPGREFNEIDAGRWDSELGAAFDPAGRWYWKRPEAPDLAKMQAQHDNLVATLQSFGVTTDVLQPLDGVFTKSIYTRDPLITVKGGAVIARLAPSMRRGEEASVTKAVASLGMPILGTIGGRGFVEGGSFAKITPKLALFGTSIRCNQEGGTQLADILRHFGVEVVTVPLSGFEFHLDGTLAMIDTDRALVSPESAPYWLPDLLREHGIQPIWVPVSEPWAVNCLTISPGHVLLSSSAPRIAETLDAIGVKVTVIDYDAVEANGGGVHCSTMELLRDDV
ncbi:dimethylarginine dimethylaminohydrolase family protein [Streptomyces sp. NPDC048253]|uniref:dimethylarginine dimethylaminohydrolase family protein n=1 Tax=Streptomyces sp. NPDC048253 TaxID=3365524 RepID=UPI00372313B4